MQKKRQIRILNHLLRFLINGEWYITRKAYNTNDDDTMPPKTVWHQTQNLKTKAACIPLHGGLRWATQNKGELAKYAATQAMNSRSTTHWQLVWLMINVKTQILTETEHIIYLFFCDFKSFFSQRKLLVEDLVTCFWYFKIKF